MGKAIADWSDYCARFWSKATVSMTGDGGEASCLVWSGARDEYGYGRVGAFGRRAVVLAHRVAYEMFYGSIPDGMDVLHKCDNTSCVRPLHLFLGTHDDNMADMAAKWRAGRAKLSEEAVQMARAAWSAGATSYEVASWLGVAQSSAHRMLTGSTYRHVQQPIGPQGQ